MSENPISLPGAIWLRREVEHLGVHSPLLLFVHSVSKAFLRLSKSYKNNWSVASVE